MINPNMKGDKGQYFTPRHVIRMCIDILRPQQNETIFDPACGSGGFLVTAMDHVFTKIKSEILENQKDYASHNVFGIDYDRTISAIRSDYGNLILLPQTLPLRVIFRRMQRYRGTHLRIRNGMVRDIGFINLHVIRCSLSVAFRFSNQVEEWRLCCRAGH